MRHIAKGLQGGAHVKGSAGASGMCRAQSPTQHLLMPLCGLCVCVCVQNACLHRGASLQGSCSAGSPFVVMLRARVSERDDLLLTDQLLAGKR